MIEVNKSMLASALPALGKLICRTSPMTLFKSIKIEAAGKRPARYMSQAFSEKIRDFLKNYLDSGFQNGGSRESI